MRPNPYIVQTLKYATLTLLGCAVIAGAAVMLRQGSTSSLTGRLVSLQQQGVIPTMRRDAANAVEGFTIAANTHFIVAIPNGVRIPRITFFGGPDYDEKRYWGRCFIGDNIEDSQYFYSMGERKAQLARPKPADTDLRGILNSTTEEDPEPLASIAEILNGGYLCYVMVDEVTAPSGLPTGIDSDNDGVNNKRERDLGLNLNDPDTDRDGISDGDELFETGTDPRIADTDRDGLRDGLEDKNANGVLDLGETSPRVPDTDRDHLCDGDGYDPNCPEPKAPRCAVNAQGDRECVSRPTGPAGEDTNENGVVDKGETDPRDPTTFGIDDWQYKWNQLSKGGVPQSDSAKGTPAPAFPIPQVPVQNGN